MTERPKFSDEGKKMGSAITANEHAREMVIALAGPRNWSDTRESWLSRVARSVGLSPRRIRAIFYQEPIRLSADEYLQILTAHRKTNDALEEISDLASDAHLSAHSLGSRAPSPREGQG